MSDTDMAKATAFALEIADYTDRFLADTMNDPDLADRSQEFRDGYQQGFREANAMWVALTVKRKLGHGL